MQARKIQQGNKAKYKRYNIHEATQSYSIFDFERIYERRKNMLAQRGNVWYNKKRKVAMKWHSMDLKYIFRRLEKRI